MVAVHLEKVFYHYLFDSKDYLHLVNERFFETEVISELYKLSKDYYDRYHEKPTKEQVEEIVKVQGLEEKITNSKLDLIYDYDLASYGDEWLTENIEAWIEYRNLDNSVLDLINYLKTTKVDTENVKEVVNTAKSIILERNKIEFKFDEGLDFFNPESHIQLDTDTFSTGYNHLDTVLGGGWEKKALYVFMGPAKVGKSVILANLTAQSVREGYNTAFLSFEMKDRNVVKRLGANLLGIKMSDYKNFGNKQDLVKQKIKKTTSNILSRNMKTPGKLFIKEFPTSSASVQDVERYLQKMEEINGIKFKTVFVDYINIMKNWRNPNSENTYMKIKQIAEDIRAMGIRNEWTIISVTQTNKSGFDTTDLTYSNISESGALIHTVDALFGIIQDPVMHSNNEYIIKLLANRNEGYKNSKKKFNINYEYMKLTEDDSPMWTDDYE